MCLGVILGARNSPVKGVDCIFFAVSMGGMKSAQDIIEAIGRDRIKDRFGVNDRVVRHYAATGRLPAQWFAALCEMAGQDLPRTLFTFRGYGDAA